MGNQNDCDCNEWNSDYEFFDEGDEYEYDDRRRRTGTRPLQADRMRRERYEEGDPDEYAVVPAKGARAVSYDKSVINPRDFQDREMSMLKIEEQRIKNKIAGERLAFDVQKRQQSKEMHDIKLAIIKKYPNILFSKQNVNELKNE